MQNYIQEGNALNVPAPAGGVVSGQTVAYGKLIGIAAETQPVPGTSYALWLVGIFAVPKVPAQGWAGGDEIYFDTVANVATNVTNGNTLPMGHASAPVAAGAGTGPVRLARLNA